MNLVNLKSAAVKRNLSDEKIMVVSFIHIFNDKHVIIKKDNIVVQLFD